MTIIHDIKTILVKNQKIRVKSSFWGANKVM